MKPADRAALLQSYAKDFCAEGDKFRAGDALNFAIGQGDTVVTPLQMNTLYSAIANGGTLWRPSFAKAAVSRDGTVSKQFDPVSNGRVDASDSTLSFLRKALSETTTDGTASNVFEASRSVRFPSRLRPVPERSSVRHRPRGSHLSRPQTHRSTPSRAWCPRGGTGAGTYGPSVRAIYEALLGVSGMSASPSKSILAGGKPNTKLPGVTSDGIGQGGPNGGPAVVAPPQRPPWRHLAASHQP